MSKVTTVDNDGDVVSTSVGTNNVTVSFAKKHGRENYGNEELFTSMQLDVDTDEPATEIEGRIKGAIAFLKTIVYEQFGVDSTVSESGVVNDVPQPEKQKAKSGGGGKPASTPKTPSGDAPSKDELWLMLAEDQSLFYDNRESKESGKYSAKSPDFKHKDSGAGLWLDKAPAFVKLALGI